MEKVLRAEGMAFGYKNVSLYTEEGKATEIVSAGTLNGTVFVELPYKLTGFLKDIGCKTTNSSGSRVFLLWNQPEPLRKLFDLEKKEVTITNAWIKELEEFRRAKEEEEQRKQEEKARQEAEIQARKTRFEEFLTRLPEKLGLKELPPGVKTELSNLAWKRDYEIREEELFMETVQLCLKELQSEIARLRGKISQAYRELDEVKEKSKVLADFVRERELQEELKEYLKEQREKKLEEEIEEEVENLLVNE